MMRLIGRGKPRFLYPGQEIRPTRAVASNPDLLIEGQVKRSVETARTRILVTACMFAVAFTLVGGRLLEVMVLKAEDHSARARPMAISARTDPMSRADIVDRNGVILATNLPTMNLYADAARIADPEDAADKVRVVLPHLKRAEVLEKLSSGKRFVYIDRNLTPRQQQAINAEGVPGLYFERSERRAYMQGPLVSHVIGTTDPDNNGIAGIEASFDQRLKTEPTPVRLSIDIRVQHAVRSSLIAAMEHFKAKAASGIILDANTSEVLAMVSLPDFSPEDFGRTDADTRFNRATLGVYEMGSTFKLFNTALALDSGQIRLTDTYDTTKPLKISRFTIRDSHPEKYWMSVSEILVRSSNIGSARMAMILGADKQRKMLDELGLLSRSTLELPETAEPLYPSQWRDVSTMTISYGHGIAVTAANMAQAVGAVVNGGILREATLLAGTVREGKQVFTPETSDLMRKLMRMVVTDGTARKANVEGYLVGGKTGTAEKVSASGGYAANKLRTTFAAAFPMDDPKYVVLVVLDEPQGLKSTYGFATAGWNAAPTGGEIIKAVAPLLGVLPRSAPVAEAYAANVPGMPSARAQQLLAAAGGSNAPR